MLELTDAQWAALCASDERNFVATIRDDIILDDPTLANDPTLLDRLVAAYKEAKTLGFQQDKELGEFLQMEAEIPGFYRVKPIASWLRKPGRPVEDRFDDLMAVTKKNLRDQQPPQDAK